MVVAGRGQKLNISFPVKKKPKKTSKSKLLEYPAGAVAPSPALYLTLQLLFIDGPKRLEARSQQLCLVD